MKILVVAERMPNRLGGGSTRQFNLIRALSGRQSVSASDSSRVVSSIPSRNFASVLSVGDGLPSGATSNDLLRFTVVAHALPEDLLYRPDLEALVEDLVLIPLHAPDRQPASRRGAQIVQAWRHAFLETRPQRGRFFQTEAMRRAIQDMLSRSDFDLVQVHQAYLMPLIPANSPPVILDMQDVLSEFEHDLISRKKKATHHLQAWLEWRKMLALERNAIGKALLCLATSQFDREKLLIRFPNAQIKIIPNGVDLEYFSTSALPELTPEQAVNSLVFTGSMNYPPNAEAAQWFKLEVLPLLRQDHDVYWKIVGWGPPPEIQALHDPPAIQVTGFVEDVRPYLAESQVVIVPLLSGSGTRLKILEAWAMGKAVVSTSLGAQGLPAVHGENILLADKPRDFAEAVIQLLGDPVKRNRLGQAGRQVVEAHFSWHAIGQELARAYQNVQQARAYPTRV